MSSTSLVLILALSLVACGSSSTPGPEQGDAPTISQHDAPSGPAYETPPFNGGADAPVVAAIALRCTPADNTFYIESRISVTDPQGPSDLTNFAQDYLGVYSQEPPAGLETMNSFQINDNGNVEWASADPIDQTWGVVPFDRDTEIQICGSTPPTSLPVEVLVEDNTGHVTTGLVLAPFVQGS